MSRYAVAGALAGLAVVLADLVRGAVLQLSGVSLLSVLELGALAGLALGAGAWAVQWAINALQGRLGALATPARLTGLAAALVSIPVGIQLFSGKGIGPTLAGTLGPWLFPALVLVCASPLFAWLFSVAARRGSRGWRLTIAAGVAVAGAALAGDRFLLPGTYAWLHVLGVVTAIGGLAVAIGLALPRPIPRWAALCALGLGAAGPLVLITFPSTPEARRYLAENPTVSRRLVQAFQWAVDLDADGASPVLGGGDCDDLDPEVSPRSPEREGNGRDENCDGLDYVRLDYVRPDRFGYFVDRDKAQSLSKLASGRPTVVLVVDALRLDRVGPPRFPHIARLARESIQFTNAFAPASATLGSVPAMWVGHAMPHWQEPSVFHRLREKGRRSAFVSLDHLVEFLAPKPADFYVDLCAENCGYSTEDAFDEVVAVPTSPGVIVREWTATTLTDRAMALLDRPKPPDVVWVHYYDVHEWAYLEASKRRGLDRYDEAVAGIDVEIGRWLERSDEVNLVFLSDHGEALGRPNVVFHGTWLFVEMVRVPLLIRIPGATPATVVAPVAAADIAPTLHDLVAPLSATHEWARRSLLGIVGVEDPGDRPIPMYDSIHISLVVGSRRFVHDTETRASWLYDIFADPEELDDLATVEPKLAQQMSEQLSQTYAWQRARQLDKDKP